MDENKYLADVSKKLDVLERKVDKLASNRKESDEILKKIAANFNLVEMSVDDALENEQILLKNISAKNKAREKVNYANEVEDNSIYQSVFGDESPYTGFIDDLDKTDK